MRRGLQVVLTAIGVVATVAGADTMVRGARGVLHGGEVSSNVDSELRFYATWYVVAGQLLLKAARRPESHPQIVGACGVGFFAAACARLLSIRTVGWPHVFFRVLTAIELAIVGVIPWQRRVVATTRM